MPKIADLLGYLEEMDISFSYIGDKNIELTGYSSLKNYAPGNLTWIKTENDIPADISVQQLTVFVCSMDEFKESVNAIRVDNSKRVFFSLMEHFWGEERKKEGVGRNTYISDEVEIGKNVYIGHNCVLDGKIKIGDGTVIWNNVTIINKVTIGRDSEIRSGVVIGHDDSISYTEDENHWKKPIRHYGGVIIGDNVVIGENTTLCRGTIDNTVLEDNVWVDAQTMISHNCYLHKNSTVVGASKLFGSVTLLENAYVTAAVIRNQLTIGKDAFVGMGAVVTKSVKDGVTVVGNPAHEFVKK